MGLIDKRIKFHLLFSGGSLTCCCERGNTAGIFSAASSLYVLGLDWELCRANFGLASNGLSEVTGVDLKKTKMLKEEKWKKNVLGLGDMSQDIWGLFSFVSAYLDLIVEDFSSVSLSCFSNFSNSFSAFFFEAEFLILFKLALSYEKKY